MPFSHDPHHPTSGSVIAAILGLGFFLGGITVLSYPNAASVTVLSGVKAIIPDPTFRGIMFLMFGWMAMFASTSDDPRARSLFIMPMQALLTIQIYAILNSIWSGQYPDGYIPVPTDIWQSRAFIFADQIWALLFILTLSGLQAFGAFKIWRKEREINGREPSH